MEFVSWLRLDSIDFAVINLLNVNYRFAYKHEQSPIDFALSSPALVFTVMTTCSKINDGISNAPNSNFIFDKNLQSVWKQTLVTKIRDSRSS